MNPSVQEKTLYLPTNDTDCVAVQFLKSGKWAAKIKHPISKVWLWVGSYTSPEEAEDAASRKKHEYESCSVEETYSSLHTNVTDFDKHPGVKRQKSGRWGSEIRHGNDAVWLGTYDTSKEAAVAYSLSKVELDAQRVCCSNSDKRKARVQTSSEQSDCFQLKPQHAYKRKNGRWQSEMRNPITKARLYLGTFDTAQEAEEAYKSKRREFDEHGQMNDGCEAEIDGSSVVNVDSIVNSYGELVGEYSRLDDELWLC